MPSVPPSRFACSLDHSSPAVCCSAMHRSMARFARPTSTRSCRRVFENTVSRMTRLPGAIQYVTLVEGEDQSRTSGSSSTSPHDIAHMLYRTDRHEKGFVSRQDHPFMQTRCFAAEMND